MKMCNRCGLLDEKDLCVRLNKNVPKETQDKENECIYFFKIIKEDGEPLSTNEHLLLQQADTKSKGMKGPV